MADKNQAGSTPEREISVDLNAADPAKAVTRRDSKDIAKGVRDAADRDAAPTRTPGERAMYKRMSNLEKNLERQFDQRLANKEAEWQRERSEMKERLDKLSLDRGDGSDKADAAHESAIAVLKAKLEAAYEKGDSKESADITLQISKLDAQFWAKKAAAAGVATRETADPNKGTTQQQQQQPANKTTGPTRAGARFISANEEWWDDADFKVEQAATQAIYIDLVNQEGFDPKSPETYKEVARQLKAKFPSLAVKSGRRGPEDDDEEEDDDTSEGRPQTRRQAPSARIEDRGNGSRPRDRGTQRTLTQEEIATMKACRLDPDNDRDVVQFLREAVALEAAQS
jgi:hypothetical protein